MKAVFQQFGEKVCCSSLVHESLPAAMAAAGMDPSFFTQHASLKTFNRKNNNVKNKAQCYQARFGI